MRGLREDLIHAVRESLEGSLKEIINTQLESFQDEFKKQVNCIKQDTEDFKVQMKKELAVVRKTVEDSLHEDKLARNNDKEEMKKLKTRADSLTDKFQHAQLKELQGQVNTLELSNVNLHNKLGLFEKSIAELTARSETTESAVSEDNSVPIVDTSSVSIDEPTEETNPALPLKNNPVEIVILMDSNSKFLEPTKISSRKKHTQEEDTVSHKKLFFTWR